MPQDRLSDVLDLIEVRSVISGASAVRGRWQTSSDIDDDLKFIAVVQGRVWLDTDGLGERLELVSGDVVVLNGHSWLTLEGGTGDEKPVRVEPPSARSMIDPHDANARDTDVIVGGRVELNPTGRQLLVQALPSLVHVGMSNAVGPQLRGHVQRLFEEMAAQRVGSDFAIRQYGQLLLLDVVRGFMHDAEMPAGWLKVLSDERLRPALALIHGQPSKAWSLEDLAQAAAMSRSTFAERFRVAAGSPPLAYLITWRMLLAQKALRSPDTRVGALAFELGYSSESSFSNAFKRHHGESPSSYRARARAAAS
ncbi:AraC family transcriptional regulator [Agreia sp.]|uniref:AraC family transcriptional regulator n=1 Tax=Agreia sp. TaxID=1872416 RepID=UPI0035BBAE45